MPESRPVPPRIRAHWLVRRETQAVLAALAAGGFQGRAVGGSVRNELMGEPVGDIDIATDAAPDEVMRLAAAAGLATVPTGLKHGTVTVIAEHHPFEVTTLREDVETFGRHATVAFTDDWAADARRRDFTMNALYCDADGLVHDPLGGYADLLARRVRFIGDPVARIREDYLRILRFLRFSAQYAQTAMDADGLLACVRERRGLDGLSAERIHTELKKLLVAPGALAVIREAIEHGLLVGVLGAAPVPVRLERLAAIERAHGLAADPMLRLAVLVLHVAEDAERLAARLKVSGQEADVLEGNVPRELQRIAGVDDGEARRLIYLWGPEGYRTALAVAWSQAACPPADERQRELMVLARTWPRPVFPIAGRDVLARAVRPGPEVGRLLRELEDWWIIEGFPDDRARLEQRLDDLIAASRIG